jgi:hypothetical protein
VQPVAIVHEGQEALLAEMFEPRDDRDQHMLDALIVQRAGEMVVVDQPWRTARPDHCGDHVAPEKVGAVAIDAFAPGMALARHLAVADRHLGRAKGCDWHGLEGRLDPMAQCHVISPATPPRRQR